MWSVIHLNKYYSMTLKSTNGDLPSDMYWFFVLMLLLLSSSSFAFFFLFLPSISSSPKSFSLDQVTQLKFLSLSFSVFFHFIFQQVNSLIFDCSFFSFDELEGTYRVHNLQHDTWIPLAFLAPQVTSHQLLLTCSELAIMKCAFWRKKNTRRIYKKNKKKMTKTFE